MEAIPFKSTVLGSRAFPYGGYKLCHLLGDCYLPAWILAFDYMSDHRGSFEMTLTGQSNDSVSDTVESITLFNGGVGEGLEDTCRGTSIYHEKPKVGVSFEVK